MTNQYRPVDRRWSQFSPVTTTTGSASICLVDNGQNNTITLDNFFAQYPDLGSPNVAGDGVPVLEIAGSDYNIRSIESAGGIQVEVGPTNNILLSSAIENGSQGGTDIILDDTATPQIVRTLKPGFGINIAPDGEAIQISSTGEAPPTNVVSVYTVDDLPPPTGLVYKLNDYAIYQQLDNIDFGNFTLELGDNTTYQGQSGLTTLIASNSTVPLFSLRDGANASVNNIAIVHTNSVAFKVDNSVPKTGRLIISDTIINDCAGIADISNLGIFSMEVVSVTQTTLNGIVVRGTNLAINVDTTLVSDWNGTLFDMNGSVSDIMDIENATIISTNPANKIIDGLANSGNISAGGLGTFRAVNIFGTFDSTSNILASDIRWNFNNVNPLEDSADFGITYARGNATPTVIAATLTPVKILATFVGANLSRFSSSVDGKLTYIGESLISGFVSASFSGSKVGGGIEEYRVLIYKNGVEIPGATAILSLLSSEIRSCNPSAPVRLQTGDELELYIEGLSDNDNITAIDVSLKASND